MSKRAVIYVRVSDDSQRQNYSIPVQVEGCLRYAQERDYIIVGDWFVDPVTGLDVEPDKPGAVRTYADDYTSLELVRPGISALTNYLKNTGADVVVVYVLNRLARDSYIRQTLERQFESLGAQTEYVLGQYEDEYGEIRKDMDATFAKWENIERVRRSREGKERKARSGKYVGGVPPYGFQTDKDAPSGLAILEEQKLVIIRIFSLYVIHRESIRGIVRILNDDKIPSPTGKKWGRSTVSKLLRYEGYTGRLYYNKARSKQTLEGRKTFQRDEDQWIEIPVPPIISEYMFQQVQNRLDENAKHSRRKPKRGRFYLLRGMIFCAHCRKPYVCQAISAGKNRRLRPSLIYRHRLKEGHCMNMQLNANPIEADVWQKIVQVILNPEKLLEGYQLTHEQSLEVLRVKHEHLQTLYEAQRSLKDKRTQLNILYSDPQVNMSREEYLEGRFVINEELESIAKQIEETDAEIADIPTPADLESFARFTAEVREYVLGNIDPPPVDKQRMLELLNVKVWIDESGNNSISGSFPENSDDGTRSFKWTQ